MESSTTHLHKDFCFFKSIHFKSMVNCDPKVCDFIILLVTTCSNWLREQQQVTDEQAFVFFVTSRCKMAAATSTASVQRCGWSFVKVADDNVKEYY